MKNKFSVFIIGIILNCAIYSQHVEDIQISKNGWYPTLEVDNYNTTHFFWAELTFPIQYITLDSKGTYLSKAVSISKSNGPRVPSIAINDTLIVAVWNQWESTYNSYIDGQLFSTKTDFTINNIRYNEPYGDAFRGGHDIAWLNDTLYIVVWTGDGYLTPVSGTGVYGRIVSTSNIFLSSDLLLSDHGFEEVHHVNAKTVINKESNKFFVTWVDDSFGNYRIFGRFFNLSGKPLNNSFLINEVDSLNEAWEIDCETDTQGNIIVVWGSGDLSSGVIKWRWIDFQENFLTDIKIISTENSVISQSVALDIDIDDDNKMVLVWEDKRFKKSEIYAQRFNPDRTKYGKEFKISSRFKSNTQLFPKVSLHNNKISTTWYEVDNVVEGVYLNIIDFYDPLLDYREVVDEVFTDKTYAFPGKDSVLISTKVNDTEGFILFAEIENENGILVDSIYLYNNGLHGDSLYNDSIFANYYLPPALLEQNYYINLHTVLSETDTISYKREKVEFFTTKGPITIADLIFNENDTIPNPGEQIRFKIALKNNGVIESISDVHAVIYTDNPNIMLQNKFVQYGDISNSKKKIPEEEFVLRINSDFSGDNNISFDLLIASKDTVYWFDDFTIYVDTVTSINDENNLPIEYKLYQNYPNPFNPKTVINYQLPNRELVKLEVFNILGEREIELVNSFKDAGSYSVIFDATSLSSGIYLYKIKIGEFSDVKKMLLIK